MFEEKVMWEYLYPLAISLGFLAFYLFLRKRLEETEKKALNKLHRRDISEPVETDSSSEDIEKSLKAQGKDDILARFSLIKKLLPTVLILLWAMILLVPMLGSIPAAYISIVAAITSVIAGFSLRPFLENLFAGIVISFFRSVRIGDTVIIDEQYGVVEEVGLVYSVIKRWDWHRFVIPNSKLMTKDVENLTFKDQYIWAHVEFFVDPDADIDDIKNIALKSAQNSSYRIKGEEPSFWVMEMQQNSIKCWLAAWAETPADAWELRSDMRRGLIQGLQKAKIRTHKNIWEATKESSAPARLNN